MLDQIFNISTRSNTESLIKSFYQFTSPDLLLQVRTGSNLSERVRYIFRYRIECRVRSLPLPELMTELGSRPSRFWFEPEFRTELRQHYTHQDEM
jgi:hypothetical protein